MIQSFIIESFLGMGGFGITYLAKDTKLEREVVLKEHFPRDICYRDSNTSNILITPLYEDTFDDSLNSFCKEAHTIAKLNHSDIVHIHDIFLEHNTGYIVMEYIDGMSFEQWVHQHADQPSDVNNLLVALLQTLSYLHSKHVFHRDIKPTNIIVRENGQPVLIDFGAALNGLPEHTVTVIGTPFFSPPEQAFKYGDIGPWSDLFALGKSFIAILGEKLCDYPEAFIKALQKATQIGIADRFRSADEWLEALQDTPIQSTPSRPENSLHSNIIWATAACLITATLAIASYYIFLFPTSTISQATTQQSRPSPTQSKHPAATAANTSSRIDQPQQSDLNSSDSSDPISEQETTGALSNVQNRHESPEVQPRDDQANSGDQPFTSAAEVPVSLAGAQISFSSQQAVRVIYKPHGNYFSIGQQLTNYQELFSTGNALHKTEEIFKNTTLRFTTMGSWSALYSQSGSYSYQKLNQHMGLLVIRGYSGDLSELEQQNLEQQDIEVPDIIVLLHFTGPDTGIAVHTDGDEGLIGNINFNLSTYNANLRRYSFPNLESGENWENPAKSIEPPSSLANIVLVFDPTQIQHVRINKSMDISKALLFSTRIAQWEPGGYFPLDSPIIFNNEYTCDYKEVTSSYRYFSDPRIFDAQKGTSSKLAPNAPTFSLMTI